ncbi:hypothetical protein ILP92_15885 [Maribius pontilimi]|uniref:Uncharacterized protein n=1 Tax=Palleronia pontilimi TaxID=1964209 RepID=A0A934IBT6_9RHOB|nr:hypothetical protein [Palleronia pontilimi]MBJ3764229.1 hypothetical protein [Palleronia pontilimi]
MTDETDKRTDRPAHDDTAEGKTELDKPPAGDEAIAIDERGPKNIRGPEGHAKKSDD